DPVTVAGALLRAARRVPGWLDPAVRVDIAFAVSFLRWGLREHERLGVESAARALRRIDGDSAHRLAFLALAERAGIDLDAALVELPSGRRGFDALAADWIALRAQRLAAHALPVAMTRGLAGDAAFPVTDARSIERAMFDEGVALSSAAPERRHVLI